MDPSLLDMLHHARDHDIRAVADRVDIDLDRVAQIFVDEHGAVAGDLARGDDIIVELGGPVDDLHRPSAEHVGGADHHRKTDCHGDRLSFGCRAGDAAMRLAQA